MTYATTGVEGLDTILNGGLPTGSSIIVEGAPGTGKTTLGVQFLYHGAAQLREPGVYITFEELPDQIYEDMNKAFGWDLQSLERQGLLRVVCMSPEMFLHQMTEPGGVVERIIRELGVKRIVIDSISLFGLGAGSAEEHRQSFYRLRNTLRKFGLTSLLLQEKHAGIPQEAFEHYVADGVIRLALQEHMQKYRKRTLEVLKMRGTRMMEGEHQYRFMEEGLHVVPALSLVEDRLIPQDNVTTTGIPKLDQLLQGGIFDGTTFLFDTNGKANYKHLLGSLYISQIKAGKKVISLNSSLSSVYDTERVFAQYGLDLSEYVKQGKIFFIEHYNRPFPETYKEAVIDVSGLDNEQYYNVLRERFSPIMQQASPDDQWFVYYDLNTIFSYRGPDFVRRFFAEEVAKAKLLRMTIVALCNFAEMDSDLSSYLERSSDGVIRTWVDGNYQYVQLVKSPNGVISEPLIVENIRPMPYVHLV